MSKIEWPDIDLPPINLYSAPQTVNKDRSTRLIQTKEVSMNTLVENQDAPVPELSKKERKAARRAELALIPTQFKHLRFADVFDAEEGADPELKVFARGGFTLAFRAVTEPALFGKFSVFLHYAFAECNVIENYNRKFGRQRAGGLLERRDENSSAIIDITELLPAGFEEKMIVQHANVIDFRQEYFDLHRCVVEQFLNEWAGSLNSGTEERGPGNLADNLIERDGTLFIDSAVLDYEEPSIEDLIVDMAQTVVEMADTTNALIANTDVTNPEAVAVALATATKTLTDIKELMLTAASDEEGDDEESDDEEESEEGADEESESEEA